MLAFFCQVYRMSIDCCVITFWYSQTSVGESNSGQAETAPLS